MQDAGRARRRWPFARSAGGKTTARKSGRRRGSPDGDGALSLDEARTHYAIAAGPSPLLRTSASPNSLTVDRGPRTGLRPWGGAVLSRSPFAAESSPLGLILPANPYHEMRPFPVRTRVVKSRAAVRGGNLPPYMWFVAQNRRLSLILAVGSARTALEGKTLSSTDTSRYIPNLTWPRVRTKASNRRTITPVTIMTMRSRPSACPILNPECTRELCWTSRREVSKPIDGAGNYRSTPNTRLPLGQGAEMSFAALCRGNPQRRDRRPVA